MREFCKFSPEFWSGIGCEKLKLLGRDALLLAMYVQTNRHTNMLGVYYLPLAYASYDTGMPLEEIKDLLVKLSDLDFCHYDHFHGYMWVVELGDIQTGGELKKHDKRVIQLQRQYAALPMLPYLPALYEKYHELYHLMEPPHDLYPDVYPIEAPSKDLRSKKKKKEKNKEIKKEKKKEKKKEIAHAGEASTQGDSLQDIFEHWKQTMNHPQAIFDSPRRALISKALQLGYDKEQLCKAITGCSYTPHNMGHNDRDQRFDGLKVIFKDAEQIDRFINNYYKPPKTYKKNDLSQNNDESLQCWLAESEKEEDVWIGGKESLYATT